MFDYTVVADMPKLYPPFMRVELEGKYIITDQIDPEYAWVFEEPGVLATEKLDGTNVSIIIKYGQIISMYNRTNQVPLLNKEKHYISEGILASYRKGYIDLLADGQHFGELIGEKVQGNPYKIEGHLWIPFKTYAKEHLVYKSFHKYPKNYEHWSNWFKEDLFSLLYRRRTGIVAPAEGIVFVHPDGRMSKLRRDMFDWYNGKNHKEVV